MNRMWIVFRQSNGSRIKEVKKEGINSDALSARNANKKKLFFYHKVVRLFCLLKCLLLAVTILTIAAFFFISLNLIVMRILYPRSRLLHRGEVLYLLSDAAVLD